MTRILEQCKGTIKDGLCMKCFNRAATSSSICIQMYEVEDKKAPVLMGRDSANKVFNDLNNSRVIKWEGLSDGGKWDRALEAMEIHASQERNRAIDECIDIILNDYQATAGKLIVEFGKLKKK